MQLPNILLSWILVFALPANVQAQPREPDLIGMTVPLSGFLAEYGEAVRNGVRMYVEDNPKKCPDVAFQWEDGQYDGPKTVTAFRKLNGRGAKLQYVWGSAPAEVVIPIAEREASPLFVLAETETVAGRSFAFNFTNPSWEFSRYLLEELRKKGFKKFALVKAEYVYFNRLVDGLRKFLLSDETLDVVASFPPSETNFRSTILKIAQAQFDAVGVFLDPAQCSLFFRQMAERKLKLQTFGTTNFASSKVIREAQGNMEGALFSDTAVNVDFRDRYIKKFGDASYISTAAQSYDMAHVICDIKPATRGKSLVDQILEISAINGVSGKVSLAGTLEEGRYFRFPIAVNVIVEGKPKIVSVDGEQQRGRD